MIIRDIDSIRGTNKEISSKNWVSARLLLKNDNMGFSFHETIVLPNTETKIWYKNHLEVVYCIDGCGEIEEYDGTIHNISPGILYALDKHDKHILRAFSKMKMICVFNPALLGSEIHDESGVYPLIKSSSDE